MKARPILFSAPMIRALLAGSKTQTRRIAKPRGSSRPSLLDGQWSDSYVLHPENREWLMSDCPYGQPGDLLWVRETCGTGGYFPLPWAYRADGNEYPGERWTPAIHMPRRASRLTLRITEVRVQRLQDISEDDAQAEGVDSDSADGIFYYVPGILPHSITAVEPTCREGDAPRRNCFANLWRHINGPDSWTANQWVWALTFEVIKANVDDVIARGLP